MIVCRERANRRWQTVATHNRHDFHAFFMLGWTHRYAATLGHRESRIDKALFFVQHSFVAELIATSVGTRRKSHHGTKSGSADAAFVVRITLQQHMPLCSCVENPQDRFKHAGRQQEWGRAIAASRRAAVGGGQAVVRAATARQQVVVA